MARAVRVSQSHVTMFDNDFNPIVFPTAMLSQAKPGLWKRDGFFDAIYIPVEGDAIQTHAEIGDIKAVGEAFTIKPSEISGMLSFAAYNTTRMAMKGICIHEGNAVATDGHKMLVRNVSDKTASMLITIEQMKVIEGLFSNVDVVTVQPYRVIKKDENQEGKEPGVSSYVWQLSHDNVTYTISNWSTVDEYPEWKEAFPSENNIPVSVTLPTAEFFPLITCFNTVIKADDKDRDRAYVIFHGNAVAYMGRNVQAKTMFTETLRPLDLQPVGFNLFVLPDIMSELRRHTSMVVKLNKSPLAASVS